MPHIEECFEVQCNQSDKYFVLRWNLVTKRAWWGILSLKIVIESNFNSHNYHRKTLWYRLYCYIIWMKKLKHKSIKWHANNYFTIMRFSKDLTSGSLVPKSTLNLCSQQVERNVQNPVGKSECWPTSTLSLSI